MRRKGFTDGYIGTYCSDKSRGVYRFSFDSATGAMTEPELFYEAPNAKWICLHGASMICPVERRGRAGVCFLELEDRKVVRAKEILEETQTPCHILQKEDTVYTANYHEGAVMVYHLDNGHPALTKRIENGEQAGCHQILLHGTDIMVPCLKQHRIRLFDTLHGYAPAGEIRFPDGSGPRHGAFNRDHTRLYVVSEWSNELFMFRAEGRKFHLMQRLPVLAEDRGKLIGEENCREENCRKENRAQENQAQENREGNASAAIRLTGDGRFLYISVRGANILAVFRLNGDRAEPVQQVFCGGVHPRDFILSGDERYLLAANRSEGGVVSIRRDRQTGLLGIVQSRIAMPEGVAIVLDNQKEKL